MKISIKETIKLAAVFLQLENLLALPQLSGEEGMLSDSDRAEAEKELELAVRCLNLAAHETASEYIPLKANQEFETSDGRIEYDSFQKRPVDICSVSKEGVPCRFRLYPSEIVTTAGKVSVSYTHLPEKAGLEDCLEFEEGKMSSRILAYGTAAEYCIICGLYEEAKIWDKRYKDSLLSAMRPRKALRLPARRWI